MRLPKLELRRFDGELTEWTAFWDSYESAIHNSTDLSAIDKFTYLRSLLEGPAATAIAGLTLSSPNYAEAINYPEETFWQQAGDSKQTHGHAYEPGGSGFTEQLKGTQTAVQPYGVSHTRLACSWDSIVILWYIVGICLHEQAPTRT